MNNFLIVAMGSSGSRFLAETLNRSKYLLVHHEGNPRRAYSTKQELEVANLWYRAMTSAAKVKGLTYGDVNSHLRYALPEYDMAEKAIILRDWREILLSWVSHWSQGGQDWSRARAEIERRGWMQHVQSTVACFDNYLASGFPVIDFHAMTTSAQYLQAVCWRFGATDLVIKPDSLSQKVNSHNKGRLTEYEAIPASIRVAFDKITREFNEKHILPHVHTQH